MYPEIGIVGDENYTNYAEFSKFITRIVEVVEPVVVHVLDKPGTGSMAIRWLANHAIISYKVWHQIPDMKVFCKPLHGIVLVHADGYMEYKKYSLERHLALIEIV